MIEIKLPDGSKMNFDSGVNGLDIAYKISEGLAKNAVAIQLNDNLRNRKRNILHKIQKRISNKQNTKRSRQHTHLCNRPRRHTSTASRVAHKPRPRNRPLQDCKCRRQPIPQRKRQIQRRQQQSLRSSMAHLLHNATCQRQILHTKCRQRRQQILDSTERKHQTRQQHTRTLTIHI